MCASPSEQSVRRGIASIPDCRSSFRFASFSPLPLSDNDRSIDFYVLLIRSELSLPPPGGLGSRRIGTLPVCVTDSDQDSIHSVFFLKLDGAVQ